MDALKRDAQALDTELRALKQRLHRRPELSFQEWETTALLKQLLTGLGLDGLELGMDTGAAAVLTGALPGKTVALRADIDAIAQQEPDGPLSSKCPGVMHGCGHDFHTACLYGAAKLLTQRRETLSGRVLFLFQPAEEITQGAQAMLDHGLWAALPEKPACLFGLHNRPELPCGQIAVLEGPIMAGKTNFRITLRGVSGHGGSPHKCVDAVVAGAALIQAIQTIVSRNADPLDALVCAVTSVHTDAPDFFVPEGLTLTGSIRYLRREAHDMALSRLEALTQGVAAAYGCTAECQPIPQVPVTDNPPSLTGLALSSAIQTVGEANVVTPRPDLGSEDFSVFGQDVPAFFYWLGSGAPGQANYPWHHPDFCTNDDALTLGAELLTRSALAALA